MKTILNISGQSYVLPATTDLAAVLNLVKGIQPVRERTLYGATDEHRYSEEHGYRNMQVLDMKPARVRLELVPDEEVCTADQFAAYEAAQKENNVQKAA